MWLLFHNKILTKAVLSRRGWTGPTECLFCNTVGTKETALHLFLHCPYISQVWFWMGNFQQLSCSWSSLNDILTHAMLLPLSQRQAMLMAVSAICWCVWKCRNTLCFEDKPFPSIRHITLLTCSMLDYWTGNKRCKVKQLLAQWVPADLDMIPLQTLSPSPIGLLPSATSTSFDRAPLLLEGF